MTRLRFAVGDWVEVRPKEEILATLDENGHLDGMPFMPEMFSFCGKRFQVYKSAHKACDTVFPTRSRGVSSAVHLQTRCDGQAHGGCQAGCLLFWKEAWLKPVQPLGSRDDATESARSAIGGASSSGTTSGSCTEADVMRATRATGEPDGSDPIYSCQATRLPYYSTDLSPYDVRQYIRDLSSGNVSLGAWLRGVIYISYSALINLGIGWGPILRWLYDRFQALIGGIPYPRRIGTIPLGQATPMGQLNLQPGEWVRVKPFEEIRRTCNVENRNRGMGFDAELVPYCGGTYRVQKSVTQILNERTGKMMHMQHPCIILEDVVCQGRYSECRMFCPRAIYPYWREIWLDRVSPPPATEVVSAGGLHDGSKESRVPSSAPIGIRRSLDPLDSARFHARFSLADGCTASPQDVKGRVRP